MAVVKGQAPAPTAPNAGTTRSPALPFKSPIGTCRVYYIGTKVFNTKAGPKNKTVIHYEKDGQRYAFASDRDYVVANLNELAKLMAPTTEGGKQRAVTADFRWVKDTSLDIYVPS